jgi:2-polyprenyl-3-methyl-5-hydroxy-6-metoxy-1,4-benzoquinol methylase
VRRYGRREPVPTAETWNAEYASGRWDYLGQLPELSRFSVLAGYLRHFKPGGALLDVGCGEGVLAKRLHPSDYRSYVGVDISCAAIDKANALGLPNASFSAADAQVYHPTGTFDAIVFNEVLYFFADPPSTVERYARALSRDGIFLLSNNTAFRGGRAILEALKRRYATLDETRVTHGENRWSWVCTVLARN